MSIFPRIHDFVVDAFNVLWISLGHEGKNSVKSYIIKCYKSHHLQKHEQYTDNNVFELFIERVPSVLRSRQEQAMDIY